MATPPKFAAGDKLRQFCRALGARLQGIRATGFGGRPGSSVRQVAQPVSLHPTRQPSHGLRNLVLLVVVVAGGALALQWSSLRESTRIGASYAARVGCVCHFVSGRDLKSCEADLAIAPLGGVAGKVWLSVDDAGRSVRAGLPLLGHQSASYDRSYGCRLEPWEN